MKVDQKGSWIVKVDEQLKLEIAKEINWSNSLFGFMWNGLLALKSVVYQLLQNNIIMHLSFCHFYQCPVL